MPFSVLIENLYINKTWTSISFKVGHSNINMRFNLRIDELVDCQKLNSCPKMAITTLCYLWLHSTIQEHLCILKVLFNEYGHKSLKCGNTKL